LEDRAVNRRDFLKGAIAATVGLSAEAVATEAPTPQPVILPTLENIWREPLVDVGLRKQLLIDDHVISHKHNLSREYGRADKLNSGNPLLMPDEAWENLYFGAWNTVLHDGEKFQMWYCAFNYCMAYAESGDGVTWTKPHLGLYDFDPAKITSFQDEYGSGQAFTPFPGRVAKAVGVENNLIGDFGHQFTLFRDEHETDEAHRFKAICSHPRAHEKSMACLLHSPDGIRDWQWYNNGEPVTGRASDTLNQILWDEHAKVYRLYTREDFGTPGGLTEFRGTRHMTNPDVKADPTNWTTVRKWELDREGHEERRRRQIMSFNNWLYEGVHFGLLQCHEYPAGINALNQPSAAERRPERDVNNLYICPCRDANSWDLTAVYAEKRFIERGPAGSFDSGYIANGPNIVTSADKHWLFYGGWPTTNSTLPPTMGIGGATLRLDGFLFLEPWVSDETGWMITKPFELQGGKLELNVSAKSGQVRVELLDADTGDSIPGFSGDDALPYQGVDDVRFAPRWRNQPDLATLKGKAVRLKVLLDRAKLYAFQVRG
jgi:hypothetical protein